MSCCVVPEKPPNKAAGETPAAAEVVEGRRQAKENAVAARISRRLGRAYDTGTALDGIRQTAKGRPGAQFTTLMHHIYAVERLQDAYLVLKRKAAAGVDGQTWQSYGGGLANKASGPVRPAGPRGLPAPACKARVYRQG